MTSRIFVPSLLLAVLAACSSPPASWTAKGPVAEGLSCNPLAKEWDCLYPYPSDFFARPDPTGATHERLEIPGDALPHWKPPGDEAQPIDFLALHPSDGFSVLAQIGVRIPGSVKADDLIAMYGDVSASLGEGSHTLLVDAETGEKVLHFSETDPRPGNVDDRILLIRPLVRLKSAHRYVVALRGLHHADGTPVTAPDGFRRIRDDEANDDVLARLVDYYDDRIFPVLQKAGANRAELLLAWDFTTESDERTTGDMLEMRRQLLTAFAAVAPAVTVKQVIEAPDTENANWIGREIKASMKVPLFLEAEEPGSLIHRGADGKPATNGTIDVPFTVRIPNSVLSGQKRGRLVQYGHGFFGSHLEMKGKYPSRFADETGSILVATDWMGMAEADQVKLIEHVITDPARTAAFSDRTHQGMMNFLALAEVAATSLKELPGLQDASGTPLYDPAHVYYYGISQGSILGTTYVSLSPRIERAALSVGGCSFGFMMSRASPFAPLLGLIENTLDAPGLDRHASSTRVELLLQTSLDRIDPVAYAPHLLANTYENSPPTRKALFQIGIGDDEVPNVAEHVFARSAGVPLLVPGPRSVFGLAPKEAPIDGSALVEFDFGIAPVDALAEPVAQGTPVHEGVRRQTAAIEMIDRFLREDGRIENTCGGVCHGTRVSDDDDAP